MANLVEIDLAKERMKFSAGHFTIFSATQRENLHGHDFRVSAIFKAELGANGMMVNYKILKDVLIQVCDSLDEVCLLPLHSRYLRIEVTDDAVLAHFGQEAMHFLPRDVKLLPIENVTVEELSKWILNAVRERLSDELSKSVKAMSVRVGSGFGQGATIHWSA